MNKKTYNQRLFEGRGLRSYLHNARFRWFQKTSAALNADTTHVVELGCFDGRLISYFASPPHSYLGLDADWEGGLSVAQTKFADHENWVFQKATTPDALADQADGHFTLAVAMETLEHIPDDILDGYLDQIARVTNGYFLVTVPNEKGPVFLIKYLAKRFLFRSAEDYQITEIINATLGRLHYVERNEHKGFDHTELTRKIAARFDIVKTEPVPMAACPLWAGFTIGIVAKSR